MSVSQGLGASSNEVSSLPFRTVEAVVRMAGRFDLVTSSEGFDEDEGQFRVSMNALGREFAGASNESRAMAGRSGSSASCEASSMSGRL